MPGWMVLSWYCCSQDRTTEEVRAGCLTLLGAVCGAGGAALWREGAYSAEEALRLCLAASEDTVQVGVSRTTSRAGGSRNASEGVLACSAAAPCLGPVHAAALLSLHIDAHAPRSLVSDVWQAVRDAAFRALGELASASRSAAAAEALSAEKRPAKKAAAERVVSGCVRAALVAPLIDAALHGRREVRGCWAAAEAATLPDLSPTSAGEALGMHVRYDGAPCYHVDSAP